MAGGERIFAVAVVLQSAASLLRPVAVGGFAIDRTDYRADDDDLPTSVAADIFYDDDLPTTE